MKSFTASPWIALTLKLVGVLFILTSLIDYIILLSTAKFQDSQWVITFTTQIVDRGFIPMLGIALLLIGVWVESVASSTDAARTAPGLRMGALIIASILGLGFLLIVPWNVVSTRDAATNQVKQIGQEATKAETQLDAQVQQFKGQSPQQLESQLSYIEQAIASGQVKGDQLLQAQQQRDQLRKFKSDPKAFAAQVDAQIGPKKTEELNKIRSRKQELEDQTWGTALRSALRTGIDSLLLAIGYIFIGWTGLRQLLYLRQ